MAWNNGVQDINTVLRSHLEDETKVVWLSGEELFSRPDLLVRPIIKWKCSLMADTMFAGNNGWSLAFPLLVMQSEGGLYVLDGNHRIGAVKIILKRDPQRQLPIPCWLLSASTPVEICRDYATIVNAIQCLGNDQSLPHAIVGYWAAKRKNQEQGGKNTAAGVFEFVDSQVPASQGPAKVSRNKMKKLSSHAAFFIEHEPLFTALDQVCVR